MKIWIDADATPRDVKEIVFRAAKRLDIPTILVANKRLDTPLGNPMITAVQVPGGPELPTSISSTTRRTTISW